MGRIFDQTARDEMRKSANALLGATRSALADEVEVPAFIGELLCAGLEKGANHKYIRRVPKSGGGYRYFYKVSGGPGAGHHDELVVGAKFAVKHGGKAGHFEITGKDDKGNLTIRHDESGHETTLSPAALSQMIKDEHASAIGAHKQKLRDDIAAAMKHGSAKQQAKLKAEGKKYGVDESKASTAPAEKAKPTKDALLALGFKEWKTDKGHHRFYAPDALVRKAFGIKVSYYGSGNVSSATVNGEKVSNSSAKNTLANLQDLKLHWDEKEGRWGIGKNDAITYKNPVAQKIVASVEEMLGGEQMKKSTADVIAGLRAALQPATAAPATPAPPTLAELDAATVARNEAAATARARTMPFTPSGGGGDAIGRFGAFVEHVRPPQPAALAGELAAPDPPFSVEAAVRHHRRQNGLGAGGIAALATPGAAVSHIVLE